MSNLKQFEKVLKVIVDGNGTATKKHILDTLGDQIVHERLSAYIWDIKKKSGIPIAAIKDGKKVIAYYIVDMKAETSVVEAADSDEKSIDEQEIVTA